MTESVPSDRIAAQTSLRSLLDSPAVEGRVAEAAVDPIFIHRWSPRAFLSDPIDEGTILSLFEAARWAPSSNNEQPWKFVYATDPSDRARFAEGLMEMNRAWASKAPMLAYLLTRRKLTLGPWAGQPNPTAWFDAGAAWMSFALQAHLSGLSAHAMGGIDRDRLPELLGIDPEEYEVVIAIAVGRRGPPELLPPPIAARERPSPRRPLGEIAVAWGPGPGSLERPERAPDQR
jgi:nitroreductase